MRFATCSTRVCCASARLEEDWLEQFVGATIPFLQEDGGIYLLLVSPLPVVDAVLDLAAVGPSDVLYDLGSGDGRLVVRAAERFGARAVGIESNQDLHQRAARLVAERGLQAIVRTVLGDLYEADLEEASVITLYLGADDLTDGLRCKLGRALARGARVVSIDMPLPDWQAARRQHVSDGEEGYTIYLYSSCDGEADSVYEIDR